MRILGIDTSLRSTGVGVVESSGSKLVLVEQGTLRTPAGRPLSQCLLRLDAGLNEVLARTRPEAAAIEGIFHGKNTKTAVILGEARGVAIAACSRAGVPVFEYPPRRVKQAIVGFGGAEKEQIGRMIMRLLGLQEMPQEDAADAMALAICHLHTRSGIAMLNSEPI